MDIGEIVSDAIKYPSSNWGKVLILGVILICSILIVPIFLVYGYLFRIIKASLAGMDELPDFDEIGDMFVDGLKIFVVAIVYAIPVVIIAWIFNLILGSAMTVSPTGGLDASMFYGIIAGNLVLLIVGLIVGLIEIIAIANMAYYDGELGAAFRFSEILDHIARIGWGKYIATYIIVAIIAVIGYFIGVLTMFILIGIILLPLIIAPYILMFGARAIALLFASSLEHDAPPESAE